MRSVVNTRSGPIVKMSNRDKEAADKEVERDATKKRAVDKAAAESHQIALRAADEQRIREEEKKAWEKDAADRRREAERAYYGAPPRACDEPMPDLNVVCLDPEVMRPATPEKEKMKPKSKEDKRSKFSIIK